MKKTEKEKKMKKINALEYGKKIGEKKDFVCIICPNSCRLSAEVGPNGDVKINGYACQRGLEYGTQEFLEPKRTLITTMRIKNGVLPVLPVRSDKELPKNKIFEAIKIINQYEIEAPIKMGDIIIENLLNLGVNVIASRDMEISKK